MEGMISYQLRYYDEEKFPSLVSGIEEVVIPTDNPTLEMMQSAVGGSIETMTRIPSPTRENVEIDAYVNEEGLLIELPVVMAVYDEYGVRPFAGSIVFVGANDEGESVSLTEEEIDFIRARYRDNMFLML